ncbi:FAD-dependent monooxygenase [Mycolicibacterium sp. Dal123E01]|uniref:FAD-dependent monooxygenase n=1 Tax=Mycolicibacterium sp. Dal123E01 TaxID=3457578 RepID=UPI00403EA3F4
MNRHAVISGAGIAGPTLAHHLAERGWRITAIERFPRRRDEGQNIDVRGAAREVAFRMGIEDEIRAANTGEIGMRFLSDEGSPVASFPVSASGEIDGPTAEFEILRGELSRILIERTGDRSDYLFDSEIADLADHGDRVTVNLQDGTTIDADLVVIAEGLHSRSRRYVTDTHAEDLGMYIAYATLPRRDTDDQWWGWQHAPESRSVHVRPDNLGTTRAMLTFMSDVRGLDDLREDDQVAILRKTFADVGGLAPRILADLDRRTSLYFSAVGTMLAPTWSKGRVALLGDAAFCPGTFGGGGTSLAMIGAYVMAGELSCTDDIRGALTRYEQFMRAHVVDASPIIRRSVLKRANPRTRAGVRAVRAAARIVASPFGQATTRVLGNRLATGAADRLRLPDYPPAD